MAVMIMSPGPSDGHTHYFWQIFVMVAVYGLFIFSAKRSSQSAANGKIIEGVVIDKGPGFITYRYLDSSGKQCENKFNFKYAKQWGAYKKYQDKYQLSQKITLISMDDPEYLWGKKSKYVVIQSVFDEGRAFDKKLLKYYPVGVALILLCEYIFIGVY